MKKYFMPETTCLKVNAQTMICASGAAPKRSGELGTMKVVNVDTW